MDSFCWEYHTSSYDQHLEIWTCCHYRIVVREEQSRTSQKMLLKEQVYSYSQFVYFLTIYVYTNITWQLLIKWSLITFWYVNEYYTVYNHVIAVHNNRWARAAAGLCSWLSRVITGMSIEIFKHFVCYREGKIMDMDIIYLNQQYSVV